MPKGFDRNRHIEESDGHKGNEKCGGKDDSSVDFTSHFLFPQLATIVQGSVAESERHCTTLDKCGSAQNDSCQANKISFRLFLLYRIFLTNNPYKQNNHFGVPLKECQLFEWIDDCKVPDNVQQNPLPSIRVCYKKWPCMRTFLSRQMAPKTGCSLPDKMFLVPPIFPSPRGHFPPPLCVSTMIYCTSLPRFRGKSNTNRY